MVRLLGGYSSNKVIAFRLHNRPRPRVSVQFICVTLHWLYKLKTDRMGALSGVDLVLVIISPPCVVSPAANEAEEPPRART